MRKSAAFVVMCLLIAAGTALAQEKAEVRESRDRFKKVLPAKKVARYYQVENLLDTEVDYNLTRAIPLMK
jgi:hypothetical protein